MILFLFAIFLLIGFVLWKLRSFAAEDDRLEKKWTKFCMEEGRVTEWDLEFPVEPLTLVFRP